MEISMKLLNVCQSVSPVISISPNEFNFHLSRIW